MSTSNNKRWPYSQPKDYEWKGTITENESLIKILAHCIPKRQDVIVEIRNMETMDMQQIEKYFGQIHKLIRIQSKNVLSPYHTFQNKSEIWIIWPFFSGSSLNALLASHYPNGIKNEQIIATILYDVACGLFAVHSMQLVHRNIRSSSLHIDKATGRTLLKNFYSLKTFKWKKHRKLSNGSATPPLIRANTEITPEQYPFTDPLLLDPSNNASFISGDIYSFGILAMEMFIGHPPNTKQHNNETKKSSQNFQDLVKRCLQSTDDRITLKEIMSHKFFANKKCSYEQVKEFVQVPMQSTESKLILSSSRFGSLITPSTETLSKNSIEIYGDDSMYAKSKSSTKKAQNDSWDFDVDSDALYSSSPGGPALILEDVEYGEDKQMDMTMLINSDDEENGHCIHEMKIPKIPKKSVTLSPHIAPQKVPPRIAYHQSGVSTHTVTSIISKLSPLASNGTRSYNHKMSLPNIIKLNVGGVLFSTCVETLRKYDTMLSKKFSGDYDAEYDVDSDSYFIDRDGTHFKHILNYLRTGKFICPRPFQKNKNCKFDALFYQELYEEACYFQIIPNEHYVHLLKKWISQPTVSQNDIDDGKDKESEIESPITLNNINQKLSLQRRAVKNQKWKLIYRASEDGYKAYQFHKNCDLQGSTMTLIKANNKIFGGYTDISWKSDSKDKYQATKEECINTFIFVMNVSENVNNVKAQKWNFIEKCYSSYGSNLPVAHEKNIGPAFGWYHVRQTRNNLNSAIVGDPSLLPSSSVRQDGIIIGDDCDVQNNSCWTYCTYFNTPKESADLAGSKHFFVKEIEVYQISFEEQNESN